MLKERAKRKIKSRKRKRKRRKRRRKLKKKRRKNKRKSTKRGLDHFRLRRNHRVVCLIQIQIHRQVKKAMTPSRQLPKNTRLLRNQRNE